MKRHDLGRCCGYHEHPFVAGSNVSAKQWFICDIIIMRFQKSVGEDPIIFGNTHRPNS